MSLLRATLLGVLLAAALAAGGCGPEPEAIPYALALAREGDRAGARLAVRPGAIVVLDGSQSGLAGYGVAAPPPGTAPRLSWNWRQVGGPELRLARRDLGRTEVRAVAEGLYRFELVVGSGGRRSFPVQVEIEVRADAPAPADEGRPAVAAPPPAAGAEFALLGSDLGELIRVFPAKTGITLRVDPEWLRPEEFRDKPLSLMARGVTPDVALELAARLAGGCFVRDGKHAAFLVGGPGWLRSERQDARFYPAAGLFPQEGGPALAELVRHGCRAALLACADASVVWRAEAAGLDVVGPESMHGRARAILAALGAPAAEPQPAPPPSEDERRREAALAGSPAALNLVRAELSEAALELGRALGVPLAWEELPERNPRKWPRVSVSGRGKTAAEVLAEIERQAGFAGHCWVRGGALWLYRSVPRPGGAEQLWTAATVRAYRVKWLEAKGVLPGALVLAVKKRIRPESWDDPATLCAYHRDLGLLLVIHDAEVHDEIVRLMHELARGPHRE